MSRKPRQDAVECAIAIMRTLEAKTGDGSRPASPAEIGAVVRRHRSVVSNYLRSMVALKLAGDNEAESTRPRLYYSEMVDEDLSGVRLRQLATDIVLRCRAEHRRSPVSKMGKVNRSRLFTLCREVRAERLQQAIEALEAMQ